MNKFFSCFLLSALLIVCHVTADAQPPLKEKQLGRTGQGQVTYDAQGRIVPIKTAPKQDSLKHRDNTDDSITIYFRFFDSTRIKNLDTSINDFTTRFPVPAHYVTLGNYGAAAHSLLFNPLLHPGFDPGFHAYDIYRLRIEDTKFYQTTRPYTEVAYLLGSKAEQTINVVHTQNIRPNFNMAFQYRLINSPGNLQNSNANHNSFRLNGVYQSRNKRYTAYGIYLANKIAASENGGIQNDELLNDYRFTNRFLIPTRLSGDSNPQRNPFNTAIVTGNVYAEKKFLLRQQYDFGQSDSLVVNDSTVIRLFYPRFRLQHTLNYSSQSFEFRDLYTGINKAHYYDTFFNRNVPNITYTFKDTWQDIQNDLSIISFPEKNNLNQFIKAGATFQHLTGRFFDTISRNGYNLFVNGEYRNRTRNQKWDLEASGRFYVNGYNVGDYAVRADLKRFVSKKLGYLELGFQNVNRTPSYIFQGGSSFPVVRQTGLKKENISRLVASVTNDAKNTSLSGEYYVVSNYTYFDSFFTAKQEATLFNVLHISAKKSFKLSRVLNLYTEAHLQQTAGNPPVHIPLFFTSNRLSFEGVYYKNMLYAIGLEVRYHTPYKADNYSPFLGQFFYQDNYTISNRPEVNAFFDFRIKTFKAFIRLENINTIGNKNNLAAQHYPQPGLWFRLGVWWTFIN